MLAFALGSALYSWARISLVLLRISWRSLSTFDSSAATANVETTSTTRRVMRVTDVDLIPTRSFDLDGVGDCRRAGRSGSRRRNAHHLHPMSLRNLGHFSAWTKVSSPGARRLRHVPRLAAVGCARQREAVNIRPLWRIWSRS